MAAAARTLTKAQLMEKLADDSKIEKKSVIAVIDALTNHIHSTLKKGGEVKLQDLGKFRIVKRKARMGRNPATGEAIKIAAKTTSRFTLAKPLKDIAKK